MEGHPTHILPYGFAALTLDNYISHIRYHKLLQLSNHIISINLFPFIMVQAIRSPVQQLRLHHCHNHNTLCKAECDGNQYYYKPIPIKSSVFHPIKAKYRFHVDKQYHQTKYQSDEDGYVKEIQLLLKPKNSSSSFDYYDPQSSLRASFSYRRIPSPMDVSESTRTSSSSLSSSPTLIKMKKRVTFNEVTEIRILPKRTIEDTLFRWYNRDDYKRFENDRKVAVHIVQQAILNRQHQQQQQLQSSSSPSCPSQQKLALNTYLDPNLYTFVGIENHIYGKQRMFNRKLNTLRHVHTVLQQQYYNNQNKSHQFHRNLCTTNTYNYENSCNQRQYNHPPSQGYNYGPTMMYRSDDESKRYVTQTSSSSSMRMMMSMHQQHQQLHAPNPALYV